MGLDQILCLFYLVMELGLEVPYWLKVRICIDGVMGRLLCEFVLLICVVLAKLT